jgi:hypothetical protein
MATASNASTETLSEAAVQGAQKDETPHEAVLRKNPVTLNYKYAIFFL